MRLCCEMAIYGGSVASYQLHAQKNAAGCHLSAWQQWLSGEAWLHSAAAMKELWRRG